MADAFSFKRRTDKELGRMLMDYVEGDGTFRAWIHIDTEILEDAAKRLMRRRSPNKETGDHG